MQGNNSVFAREGAEMCLDEQGDQTLRDRKWLMIRSKLSGLPSVTNERTNTDVEMAHSIRDETTKRPFLSIGKINGYSTVKQIQATIETKTKKSLPLSQTS
jgi:hypothetical protein